MFQNSVNVEWKVGLPLTPIPLIQMSPLFLVYVRILKEVDYAYTNLLHIKIHKFNVFSTQMVGSQLKKKKITALKIYLGDFPHLFIQRLSDFCIDVRHPTEWRYNFSIILLLLGIKFFQSFRSTRSCNKHPCMDITPHMCKEKRKSIPLSEISR